jgi:hypothetical protein
LYYIQEVDKPNWLFKFFNIIKLERNTIILPINEQENNEKKLAKLAFKTNKILQVANSKKVILSKKVKSFNQYVNCLYTYNIDIVDGKWLCEVLSIDIMEYLLKKINIKNKDVKLSILVNDLSDIMLENIKIFAKKYKNINIVTNHIEKFKNIEEDFLEKDGISITVTNNKKKSLIRSNIIINVDFPTELINKYKIYERSIILNLKGNVNITQKRFNGLNIKDYEINFANNNIDIEYDYEKEKYFKKEIYEANLYKKQPYKEIRNRIKREKIEIIKLVAQNTII